MKLNGDIIGVVEIIDKADGSSILTKDLQILSVFADLAAQAIGNARAIEHDKKEIRDLKQELQGKYEIIGESNALRKVISDAAYRKEMVDHNHELGKAFFSYSVLRRKLRSLITTFTGLDEL